MTGDASSAAATPTAATAAASTPDAARFLDFLASTTLGCGGGDGLADDGHRRPRQDRRPVECQGPGQRASIVQIVDVDGRLVSGFRCPQCIPAECGHLRRAGDAHGEDHDDQNEPRDAQRQRASGGRLG